MQFCVTIGESRQDQICLVKFCHCASKLRNSDAQKWFELWVLALGWCVWSRVNKMPWCDSNTHCCHLLLFDTRSLPCSLASLGMAIRVEHSSAVLLCSQGQMHLTSLPFLLESMALWLLLSRTSLFTEPGEVSGCIASLWTMVCSDIRYA